MKEKNKKVWIIVIAAVCAGVLSIVLLLSNSFIPYRIRFNSSDYETEIVDHDKVLDYAKTLHIDESEYTIPRIMLAKNKKNGHLLFIVQCGSAAKAEKFVRDNDYIFDMFEDYYSSIDVDAEVRGHFVIVGSKSMVDAALGR